MTMDFKVACLLCLRGEVHAMSRHEGGVKHIVSKNSCQWCARVNGGDRQVRPDNHNVVVIKLE